MATDNKDKRLYEGLFLVDSALASADWDAIITTIKTILERAEAEIVSIKKWDDRKLAYDIRGTSRGVYILCYFRADGVKIQSIERDVHLSEQIMRALILRVEHLTQEDIDKETTVMKVEAEKQKEAQVTAQGEPRMEDEHRSEESGVADAGY